LNTRSCPPPRLGPPLLAALLACAACHDEARRLHERVEASHLPWPGAASPTQPGPLLSQAWLDAKQLPARDLAAIYTNNAWAVSEGQRLFRWYNCAGCHARGGGGMGPALMDERWLYGASPEEIFITIAGGRPNGMPAYGARVPAAQTWQLVAYVRSLSGGVPKSLQSPRAEDASRRLDPRGPVTPPAREDSP
jgi:cytochrome c oxidase cbb3-type subunit III